MNRRIEKAVVLGAGTMGARIAAHFANAGLPVLLLDIVPPGAATDAKSRAQQNCARGTRGRQEIQTRGVFHRRTGRENFHRKF